jgi:GT2 family glycosyltransferase
MQSHVRHLLNMVALLEQRVAQLASSQANLESRLTNVEQSVIFRSLRWIGGLLSKIGVQVERGVPKLKCAADATDGSTRSYCDWTQEAVLHQLVDQATNPLPRTSPGESRRISVFLDASGAQPRGFEETVESLRAQTYAQWDLWIFTGPAELEWLTRKRTELCLKRPVEVIADSNINDSIESALARCASDFVALLDSRVILEPDAFESWLAALDENAVGAYSDWDYIDAAGVRHSPRFTPELSPELLNQTLYWGHCFLARVPELRAMDWKQREGGTVFRDVATELAQRSGAIPRVARMLWHRRGEQGSSEILVRAAPIARASQVVDTSRTGVAVVVCSRKPEQLRKSLQTVLPTLGPTDEMIVVAHQSGNGPELARVAASHSVQLVPYTGAFHFGFMNALGVNASKKPIICCLNDDVYPIAPEWLDLMRTQALRPEVGAVGALLLYPDGTVQHAGVAVGGWPYPAHVGRLRIESAYWPWLRMTRDVTAVTGACMMLRRDIWDELGGFDARFPVNYNDIDFCLRAGERGYRVILEARAVLTHEESRTRVAAVRPGESELFYRRWGPVIVAPDKFFNPQLGHENDSIELPAPWTWVR